MWLIWDATVSRGSGRVAGSGMRMKEPRTTPAMARGPAAPHRTATAIAFRILTTRGVWPRSLARVTRPPSVDALARSLADCGLPHPLLVDVARDAIEAGDPGSAAARAETLKRLLLQRVINATGVLLHTNL